MKTKTLGRICGVLVSMPLVVFLAWAAFSRIETVRPVVEGTPDPPAAFDLVARQTLADGGPFDQLLVYCDADRGNLVYVAQCSRGVSVNVVFDPERCAPKEK
jgi:hypothetical protein